MLTARGVESDTMHRLARRAMGIGPRRVMTMALASALLVGCAGTFAADTSEHAHPQASTPGKDASPASRGAGGSHAMGGMMGGSGDGQGMGGMMGGSGDGQGMGGMMGMMDMMERCNRMHGGMGASMMPQLPPGNEKLQMQMHAEMMQKMGETLAKYAAQLKDDRR